LLAILNGVNNNEPTEVNKIIKKYMGELSKTPPQDLFHPFNSHPSKDRVCC
jgi:hypothetical protein